MSKEKGRATNTPRSKQPPHQRKDCFMTSSVHQAEPARAQRYRGVSYTRPIGEAKRLVPVIDQADRLMGLSGLRRVGKEWVGRCRCPTTQTGRRALPSTRQRTFGGVMDACAAATW